MQPIPAYLRRYRAVKKQHPDEVLLTRRPFSLTHAAFDADANILSNACEVPTTVIVIGDEKIKAALINSAALVQAIQKLGAEGHNTVVIDD